MNACPTCKRPIEDIELKTKSDVDRFISEAVVEASYLIRLCGELTRDWLDAAGRLARGTVDAHLTFITKDLPRLMGKSLRISEQLVNTAYTKAKVR